MPAFGTVSAPVLTPGRPITLWSAEAIVAGGKSQQISMHRGELPTAVSVELKFAADPGLFQIDFQTSDQDVEAYYTTKQSIVGGLNASFVGRMEIPEVVAKFARLVMVTKTNAVNVTATAQ